ncbi:SLC13 family permease [Paracoccus sp. Z118]|uniref:SLC13 family permease n=1 Tax=Paracoccus sp. Z118 TaxID=2851017 RepID=UPI001C2C60DD|nr:SLC13 family permease [Paracoccus sp. Z118]MBV0891487.1 SLC13 family permease [Paracoccus sp. Z118]
MTTPQVTIFAIFAVVMVLMIWGRWRYDLVAFAGLIAGVLAGLIPAEETFTGFSNPATFIVALILIVTAGLQRAGVVAMLTRRLANRDRSVPVHVGIMAAVGAAISGFMNNVAALAILMPIDLQAARKAKRSPTLTLMPLAFATVLGGVLTLIGTPPNLLASAFREELLGEGYRMFDFLPVGGAVALAGVAFITLIGWRLMPDHSGGKEPVDSREKLRDYVAALVVPEDSATIGKTLGEVNEVAKEAGVRILAVERGGTRHYRTAPMLVMNEADRLVIEAGPAALEEFRSGLALAFPEGDEGQTVPDGSGRLLVEAVVPPVSRLIGRRTENVIGQGRIAGTLLGIQREGQTLRDKLGAKRIRSGDVLLILMPEPNMADIDPSDLMVLERGGLAVTREKRLWLAVGLFAGAIALVTAGLTTMATALSVVVVLYVLAGILTMEEIYDHVDWPVIILLGAMIPLGEALETTGASALIAEALGEASQGYPAWVALLLMMIVTMLLSDILNNNATVIIALPVGIRLAEAMGVNPDAFIMGIAIAASCAFLTPIGHQNNAIIMGPGGYRFSDYWKLGLPLEIISLAVAVPLLLVVFPL